MRKHQLTEAVVAQGVQAVLAEAEGAQRAATVSALAQHLGVSRQTLYRDFGEQTAALLTRDAERRSGIPVPRGRITDTDGQTIARLRREKDELTRHLHIYEDHIRRLTLDNARLADELAKLTGVADLSARRRD
ncbi:HTH domain-containing protein [Streptomyces sp. NBC_01262]|uniref:HTH domain-containing protein n=1 Tax=Streptomyces sp. NBC_01262 TaxID=2903803 RepID=UPI002E35396B|nr:HTH domain-containing protein [Streptomyces sp. NBC_01262]